MAHKIVAGLFVLFAALQYNDQDFYIWIPIYLIVGVVIWMYGKGKFNLRFLQILLGFYVLGMISYYPDVISWIKDGTPSITGSMKAESPFVEFMREFFGLAICAIALGYYCYLASKKASS
ncbi:MAG: transmembrane 220 family protein [Bacteroidota bacterium]